MVKGQHKRVLTRIMKFGLAFIIAFFFLIIWFSVNLVVDKMEASAVHTTQNLLDKLANNLQLAMDNDERAIENFAKELHLQNEDELCDQMKNFAETYDFLNIYYIDALSGKGIDSAHHSFDYSIFPFPETALTNGISGFSDAYNGSYGLWETVYQTPIKRDGENVGALYVQIELNKYDDGTSMNFYGESGMAYLFDVQTKNIVLMPATPNYMMTYMQQADAVFEELGFSEKQMKEEVYPAIDRKEKLILQGKLQDERVYLSLVSISNQDGWYLCGIVSASEIQQEATLILQMLTAILIIMLLVMVFIISLIILELYHRSKVRMEHLREIEMQNAIYDTMADASDSVLCIFNKELKKCDFTFQNIERILGITTKQFMNNDRELHQLLDAADATLYERLINGDVTKPETYQISYLHPIQHEIRELRIGIKTLEIQSVEYYMLIMEDVTYDIQIQDSLQMALANATQASKAKSEFLSHMSHEIRTPINAIIGMREIAANHLNDQMKVKDCLNKISQSSHHLLELVNDILDISKIESGKMSLHQQGFVLSDCLSDVFNIIKTQAEAKKQTFILETQEILHDQLIGDEIRIKQVLINLLNNAVKYTQKDGEIFFQIKEIPFPHKEYSNYIFMIRDNGVGMSQEFIEHIGKPFEQESNIFHKSEMGSGLGLSIVKNIITMMGGFFRVESELGKGTTIWVELALRFDNTIDYRYNNEIMNLKVIVIDDDEQVLHDVKKCLEAFCINCDIATNSKDGFSMLEQAKLNDNMYDVAIIDWKMPDENGIDLTKRIRLQISRNIPVIFISAYDWSDIESMAKEAGVNDFIEKPLLTKRLYDALIRVRKYPQVSNYQEDFWELENKRILIVEDNEVNREIAVELLEMKGIITETAVNGEEALNMFKASQPFYYDLILMDLQMPIMDGFTAAKAIRSLPRADALTVPIVAMTANAFSEDIAHCKEVGMNAHLGKPIETKIMYECIIKQVNERKKAHES